MIAHFCSLDRSLSWGSVSAGSSKNQAKCQASSVFPLLPSVFLFCYSALNVGEVSVPWPCCWVPSHPLPLPGPPVCIGSRQRVKRRNSMWPFSPAWARSVPWEGSFAVCPLLHVWECRARGPRKETEPWTRGPGVQRVPMHRTRRIRCSPLTRKHNGCLR